MPVNNFRPRPRLYRSGLYRGGRRIIAFMCPGCGFRVSAGSVQRQSDIELVRRLRPNANAGYVNVRQLRLFIEAVRSQVNWDSTWVSMDELYRIIEYISQMDNNDSMELDRPSTSSTTSSTTEDVPDTTPLLIADVLNRFENLDLH
ncbi:hypothetical protein FRC12_004329 [Ceratobasidium sp. 428]|nr:hypothetical protein FRC12_004329 [Ceratobasidium sp. 428]